MLDGDRDDDGGGVDFLGDFEVVELAGFLQLAHADEGDVHQGDRLVLAAERDAGFLIALPGALDGPGVFAEGDCVDLGEECGVAAVVGPVSVEHPQLGEARVALFLVAEIGLAEGHVLGGHREAEVRAQGGGVVGREAGEDGDVGWGSGFVATGDRRHGDFVGIDRVDDEILDAGDLVGG